ncbi:MAG: YggS family pyridoxal phosphate-dependent enzyme [Parachlamydiales bacterium]|jgi:hypothetical protein
MKLENKYAQILEEVDLTARTVGRSPQEITLIAVCKNHTVEEISAVHQAGCLNFGENRLQEALPKMDALPQEIQWHLIGTLQKNKVNKALGRFALIHSVDSFELAEKISEASQKQELRTKILIQVNTSGESTKHGFTPQSFAEIVEELAVLPHLDLEGLMTMAPLDATEKEIHTYFSRLRKLRDETQLRLGASHHFHHLSMGMSHDFKIAIEEGATLLRVGTAIFSDR